jgi:hypothetical protein
MNSEKWFTNGRLACARDAARRGAYGTSTIAGRVAWAGQGDVTRQGRLTLFCSIHPVMDG